MRLGDVMVVGLYLMGAGFLALLILCAVGYCGAADMLVAKREAAARWIRRRRRAAALALGGDTVVAAGPELSKAARIMAAEGPASWDDWEGSTVDVGPAPGATMADVGESFGVVRPWSWDDLPAWMSDSVRARYVGTFDPLPDRAAVEAAEGPSLEAQGAYDFLATVGTYDECPLDNPDRAGELHRWEDDGGPAYDHPACETGARPDPDSDRWQVVAVVQPDGAPDLCCVVECLGCGSPNPSFRVRCHHCGAHLATGRMHPAGEFDRPRGRSGPRGTDTISGGASGDGGAVTSDAMPGAGQVAIVLDRIKRETWGPAGQGPESVTVVLSVAESRWRVYVADDGPGGIDPPGWWGLSEYRWTDDALVIAGYLRSQAQAQWEGEQAGQREEVEGMVSSLLDGVSLSEALADVRVKAADPGCRVEVEGLPSVRLVAGAIAQQRKLNREGRTFRLWVYPGCVNDGDGWGVLAEGDDAPAGCRVVATMTADKGESSRHLARRMLSWARSTAALDDGLIEGARLLASGAD